MVVLNIFPGSATGGMPIDTLLHTEKFSLCMWKWYLVNKNYFYYPFSLSERLPLRIETHNFIGCDMNFLVVYGCSFPCVELMSVLALFEFFVSSATVHQSLN